MDATAQPLPRHHQPVPRAYTCVVDGHEVLAVEIAPGPEPGWAEVSLRGELCHVSAPTFAAGVGSLIDEGTTHIRVRLAEARLLAAAGVSVLVEAERRLFEVGGTLHLDGAEGITERVLDISGIDHTVPSPHA